MLRSTRVSAVCLAFVLLGATAASAGIVPFNISQTWSQGSGQSDITATAVSLGGAGSFTLDPGFSEHYFDFDFGGGGTFSTIGVQIEGYYFLRSYALGDFVGLGNFGDDLSSPADWDTILVNDVTAGVWGASHNGHLGFRSNTGNYGWIDYSFTRAGGISTLTLNNGAYEDLVGTGIVIGGAAVPEPSTLALFGLGACAVGFAAIRRRRRAS